MCPDINVELSKIMRAAYISIKRGDIVSNRWDPVHVGQVLQINITSNGRFAVVRWFDKNWIESQIQVDDLQIAEEWK